MTALTKERDTTRRDGDRFALPAAAGVLVFAGGIVCVDPATGNGTKGATSTTLRAVGVAETTVDNTGGTAGAKTIPARRDGWFRFTNSAAADALTSADIGADCYLVDDQTVAKTSATNTRVIAGRVRDIDAAGVWISFP